MAAAAAKINVVTKKPFIIGVGGGSASGKSSVCSKIMEQLGQEDIDFQQRRVAIISQESFYRELDEEELDAAQKGEFNFDHPDAFDMEKNYNAIKSIASGKTVEIPTYDFDIASTKQQMVNLISPSTDVILFEGILTLYFKEIRDLLDMKLFVDTDSDTRLSRRVLRDTQIRGRDLDRVLATYTNFVKPAFEDFCLPTKKYADVIIPRGSDNTVAIDLIVQHIKDILSGNKKLRKGCESAKRPRTISESNFGRPGFNTHAPNSNIQLAYRYSIYEVFPSNGQNGEGNKQHDFNLETPKQTRAPHTIHTLVLKHPIIKTCIVRHDEYYTPSYTALKI